MAFEAAVAATAVAVTTSNAVVATLPIVAEAVGAPEGIVIEGYVNYSPAATGVSITLQVRQGNAVGGTQVGPSDVVNGLANPNSYSIPFSQVFAGLVPPYGNQFCLCAQGGTAGGTINNVVMKARALNPSGTP